MSHVELKRVAPPALPNAPADYKKMNFDQHNNVLRLYFHSLDNVIEELISDTAGASRKAYAAKTAAYTITEFDFLVECTGTFTVTLRTAVGIAGQEFQVKNSGTGTITLVPNGSETMDGEATKILGQYDAMKFMSNGANWIIV